MNTNIVENSIPEKKEPITSDPPIPSILATPKTDVKPINNPFLWGTIKNNQNVFLSNILIYIKNGEGKTLIYAVNDTHADLIVKILKEIFEPCGVDNDAIMKITGSVGGGNKKKVLEAIKRFKNEKLPNIVVTVDLLTTGIDIPKICNLVFIRRVKSRILYEQMIGRATRLCEEINKTHFKIYDCVGFKFICEFDCLPTLFRL